MLARIYLLLTLVALSLLVLLGPGVAAEKTGAPKLPKNWKFELPSGDAEAGRAAVREMQCYGCHRFPGSDFPEARTSGGVGPDLGPAYSHLPREFLAESIIGTHKHIAGTLEQYRGLDKVSSKMGDYSSIMSVRQLIDIVEFLKHSGGK
jgi:hypothetical protein